MSVVRETASLAGTRREDALPSPAVPLPQLDSGADFAAAHLLLLG